MAVSRTHSGHRGRIGRAVAVAACAAAVGVVPSAALATPGSGVSGTIVAKGTSEGGLKIKTRGRTDVVVRTITIAPGGSTGWHYHQGQVLAVVQSGTLTRTMSHYCMEETNTAGQSFVEPAGSHHVHIGRNLGTEPVVLTATYFVPAGAPLSVDAPDPGCDV